MAPVGDLEPVLLGQVGVLLVAVRLGERVGALLVVDVADPLQEQQREDVRLEVRRVDGAAQDVGGVPEHRFERAFSSGQREVFRMERVGEVAVD